jgi:hypothetical protein
LVRPTFKSFAWAKMYFSLLVNCVLLGSYAASSGSFFYRRFGTTYRSHLLGSKIQNTAGFAIGKRVNGEKLSVACCQPIGWCKCWGGRGRTGAKWKRKEIRRLEHHHHISVMELGHLLTRSGVTYPEVSSNVCHNSFCQLGNSVSLPWVIYYEAFYLHVVFSFSSIRVTKNK